METALGPCSYLVHVLCMSQRKLAAAMCGLCLFCLRYSELCSLNIFFSVTVAIRVTVRDVCVTR